MKVKYFACCSADEFAHEQIGIFEKHSFFKVIFQGSNTFLVTHIEARKTYLWNKLLLCGNRHEEICSQLIYGNNSPLHE